MGQSFLWKSDITVQTDHQPPESIFKKPLNKAPRRLQAMRMRLQRWSFEVKYKKGKNRELTLKCKLKCYEKPMKDPLGVSPSKGNQGTTQGKGLSLSDLIAQSAE